MAMVKKNIKFPLEMKDGVKVRTIEELKANYDIESILNYYFNGKLKVWLEQRFYSEVVKQLERISEMAENDIPQILCSVFEQDFPEKSKSVAEKFLIKRKKIETVRKFTVDQEIIENIDFVATSQEELENILAMENDIRKIFLLGEQFEIDGKSENREYIGINQPNVKLIFMEKLDTRLQSISFKNVILISETENELLFVDISKETEFNFTEEELNTENYRFTNGGGDTFFERTGVSTFFSNLKHKIKTF
jgi:hypothetical protein